MMIHDRLYVDPTTAHPINVIGL